LPDPWPGHRAPSGGRAARATQSVCRRARRAHSESQRAVRGRVARQAQRRALLCDQLGRPFQRVYAEIKDLDFSFADEALACTVVDKNGTSAIGLLRDDGKGMRTVTEGDVLDREPRWAPGGVGEIVYASAGIGRTKSGARVGLSPFSLQRLKLADSTVEVLVSDAKYDYLAPVQVSKSLIYAVRRAHRAATRKSPLGVIATGLLAPFRKAESQPPPVAQADAAPAEDGHELVRISERRMEVVARHVLAFDVTAAGVIVYSTGNGLFRLSAESPGAVARI